MTKKLKNKSVPLHTHTQEIIKANNMGNRENGINEKDLEWFKVQDFNNLFAMH